jgi:hypothetical protein
MNDFQNEPIHAVTEDEIIAERTHTNSWLAGGAAVLALAVGVMGGYMIHSHKYDQADTARDAQVSSEVSQLQGQIDSLKSQLSQTASAPVAAVVTQDELDAANAAAKRRAAADAKQFKSMQSSLSDQQKALSDTQSQVADTRSQVDQTRSDLQAGIDSTRTDLNGSIARTHDELVALEQKGERSYFEFDITQAKHFQKEGPLQVSLRKTDVKHGKFDLAMVVNDKQLGKKNVNLYEPIWISGSDRHGRRKPQPRRRLSKRRRQGRPGPERSDRHAGNPEGSNAARAVKAVSAVASQHHCSLCTQSGRPRARACRIPFSLRVETQHQPQIGTRAQIRGCRTLRCMRVRA